MELFLALFLFFIGAGASTISVSSYYVFKNRIVDLKYFDLARYSVLFGTTLLLMGIFTILYELLSIEFSSNVSILDNKDSFSPIFFLFVTNSFMSYLVVTISIIIPIAILYILSFSPLFNIEKRRLFLAKINFLLSSFICFITAFLMHGVVYNNIWDNLLIVFIFFISTLCSGVAIVLFLRSLIFRVKLNSKSLINFSKINVYLLLLGFSLILVFALVLSIISISQESLYALRISYLIGKLWWFGVVGMGFAIPLCIAVVSIFRPISSFFEYLMFSSILCGAFCLKYTILLAGYFN